MQNALINYLFFCLIFFLWGGGGGGGFSIQSKKKIVFIIHLLCATNSEMSLGIRIRFCNSYFLNKHKF